MDRRTFLRTTTAAAATTTVIAEGARAQEQPIGAPAVAMGLQELTFSSPWNADLPVFGTLAADLATRLQTALSTRYRIAAAHTAGDSDLVLAPADAITPSQPAFAFFAGLPGSLGLRPHAHQAWIAIGGGQMLWDDLSAPHGWKPLLAGHTGSRTGLWSNRALHATDDLVGSTIAISGLGGRVARAMGARTVELPPAELASALGEGRVAAVEWGNPLAALMLGLPKAATHFYRTGIHGSGTALALNVRTPTWDRLSASDRAIIEGVAATTFALSLAEADAHLRPALDAVARSPASLMMADLPAEIADTVDKASRAAVMDIAATSFDNARIHASHSAFAALMGYSRAHEAAVS